MFKSFYLFIYIGWCGCCCHCCCCGCIFDLVFGFSQSARAALALGRVLGLGSIVVLFVCLFDAQILLRRLGLSSQLSVRSSQFDSKRNEKGQLHVLIAACNCPATANAAAIAAVAGQRSDGCSTCDNIFIIFASFFSLFFCCLLPLSSAHRQR